MSRRGEPVATRSASRVEDSSRAALVGPRPSSALEHAVPPHVSVRATRAKRGPAHAKDERVEPYC